MGNLYQCMQHELLPALIEYNTERLTLEEAVNAAGDPHKQALDHFGSVEAVISALDRMKQAAQSGREPPKGALAKVKQALSNLLATIKKIPASISNLDGWMTSKIQQLNAWIDENYSGKPLAALFKRILKKLRDFCKKHPAISKLLIGILGAGIGFMGLTPAWLATGAFALCLKILVDVLNGKKLSRAIAINLALGAAGVLAGQGIDALLQKVNSAIDVLPPDFVPPPDVNPPVEAPTPAASVVQQAAKDPWVERLRELVDPGGEGVGIPKIDGASFGQAFKTARQAMGPGHVFTWMGKAYTTNTAEEGLLFGLNDAAKNFIKGIR
jgi:hypothetical protein